MPPLATRRLAQCVAVAGLALCVAGCATTGDAERKKGPGEKLDPWEGWNRKVFAFNEGLDKAVLKPVATAYQKVVPEFVRTSVTHFFVNAEDGWSAINHFLQGKWESGFEMTVRFSTNTVLGVGGLLDIATEAGLPSQPEDLGQTLGAWGFGAGAYIVWPVLGPSSVRDSVGLPFDLLASPALAFNDGSVRWGLAGLHLVDTRANLLAASRVIDEIALDKYTFVRDAYLTRRRSLVYDGNPPESQERFDEDDSGAPPSKPAPAVPGSEGATPPAAPASAASAASPASAAQ
jgi:phospholipid-binding lipoprotein MlaA